MLDGVKLALDLMHPRASGKDVGTTGFPTVFIQCRYMRGVAPRWPFSIWSGHRPVDFINQDLKVALLKAGYAVVSIDVRGTGTSCEREPAHRASGAASVGFPESFRYLYQFSHTS